MILRAIVVSVLLLPFGCAGREASQPPATSAPPAGEASPAKPARTPAEVVTAFGERLKQVSVLAPPDVAAASIREHYADLVAPALLTVWMGEPAKTPGRQVSSPYPDRIEIKAISEDANRAEVTGEVVEATNQDEVARATVRVELALESGAWRITAYERRAANTLPHDEDYAGQQEAIAVVRRYYEAIDAGDYARAYRSWGSHGPPGQTLEEFTRGFADTRRVRVDTGAASRIEGAAGSRFVEVPVTIVATTALNQERRYEGTYTLRRVVVDGAPEVDRRWHIDRGEIRETIPDASTPP